MKLNSDFDSEYQVAEVFTVHIKQFFSCNFACHSPWLSCDGNNLF